MKNKQNNKVLIQQLEAHAKEAKLLEQVKDVALTLKNIKIYKKKYLVIDKKDK
jgi:hypothetical protein